MINLALLVATSDSKNSHVQTCNYRPVKISLHLTGHRERWLTSFLQGWIFSHRQKMKTLSYGIRPT